jgi:hypothetical protein
MSVKFTLSDKIAVAVIESLRAGVQLRPTIGKTAHGNMNGFMFTNEKNATIHIQAFTKEGGKNAKFVIAITPAEGRTTEIFGKHASLAWKIINNPTTSRREVDIETLNEALIALGLE